MHTFTFSLPALALASLTALSAQAAYVTPTAVAAVSSIENTGANNNTKPVNTINSRGLSSNTVTATHNNESGADSMWGSAGVSGTNLIENQFITFDLGSTMDLTSMYVWNYNQFANNSATFTNRGVNQYDLLVSSDNVTFTEVLTDRNLTQGTGTNTLTAQTITFPSTFTNVRYVTIAVDSNFGGTNSNTVGLSEVRFENTVPEPTTLGLLGLGAVGLLRRRRNA